MTLPDTYDFDFLCTYLDVDNDDLYRSQLLQAFCLNNWDDKLITERTDDLFVFVEEHFTVHYARMITVGN